jgi:hypothetical protein
MQKSQLILLIAVLLVVSAIYSARAQQVAVGGPHPTITSSFYEQVGVNWGIRGNGWFFQFGGPAVPPFGGFDPNAGANFGFAGPNGFFNLTAGQGTNSTFVGQTPMVTVPNGGTGAFFDQTLRPFVTGVIPVVGGEPPAFNSVLQERLSRLEAGASTGGNGQATPAAASGGGNTKGPSSAERGELGVAEIKARKAAEDSADQAAAAAEIEALLEKARGAIAASKPGVAKIHLQMAARRATGDQREAILKQIEQLGAPAK